jgi:SAM-dependent methyltransferase
MESQVVTAHQGARGIATAAHFGPLLSQRWRRRESNPRNVSAISGQPYYRRDLALVHHLGYAFHADACAPGILALLEPIRERRGLVLELGCGSGALTRHLVEAGHRVVATDASPPMLELAREAVSGVEELRLLKLPNDPLPDCDAVVSVGHVLSYLPSERLLEAALVAVAKALRRGGLLAIDLLDLRYGDDLRGDETRGRVGDEWAVVVKLSRPDERLYVRAITTFVRSEDGSWRRDDERHENVLVDTARIPAFLATLGLEARVAESFGEEELPPGLVAIAGSRPG